MRAFSIPASTQPAKLQYFAFVGAATFGACGGGVACWQDVELRLLGWNTIVDATASPLNGTLFDIDVSQAFTLTPNFGIDNDTQIDFFPTSLLEFDLSGAGPTCPQTGCVIAVRVAEEEPVQEDYRICNSSMAPPPILDVLLCDFCAGAYQIAWPTAVRISATDVAPACSNSLDDDNDGKIDSADFGCTSASDTSEKDAAYVCDDGIDNDGDTFVDYPTDPGCAHARGKKENPVCNDGLDNDGDNQIDFPFDSYCTSASGSNEAPPPPSPGGCGIGPELAALLPLLATLRRRRRARSA